ncbi:hypothetical protein BJ741DRAFT_38100 [Chytriomyces cf. hyalinus JEL632]|nr:hypothetical protein BJ741DRAFT_38100 [Chytriomyces cf. hyalinus JEL632]
MNPTPHATLRSKRHSLLATTTKSIFSLWAKPSVVLLKKALPLCIECRKAYLVTAGPKKSKNASKSTPTSFLALVRRNPSSPAVHEEVDHHVDNTNCTNCLNIVAAPSKDASPSNDFVEVVSEQALPVSESNTPSLEAPTTPHESPSILSMTREPNSPMALSDIPVADLSFVSQETGNDLVNIVSEQEAPVSDQPPETPPETPHQTPSILSTARIPEVNLSLAPQEAEESHTTATTEDASPYLVNVVCEQDGPVSNNNTPFLESPETPHESPSILSTTWEPSSSIVLSDIPEADPSSVPQETGVSPSTAMTEPTNIYKSPAMQHHRAKSEPTRQHKRAHPRKRVIIHNGSKKEHPISNKNQQKSPKQSLPSAPEKMSPPQKQTAKRKPSQLKRRMSVASTRVSNWFTFVKSKFRRRSAL